MLRNFTAHTVNSQQTILANVWRVYQILLEYACKTDYKLITRYMEESHLGVMDRKQGQIEKLNEEAMEKDKVYYAKMREVHHIINTAEQEKIDSTNDRIRIHEEMEKV